MWIDCKKFVSKFGIANTYKPSDYRSWVNGVLTTKVDLKGAHKTHHNTLLSTE
jgi:hypothetical protein